MGAEPERNFDHVRAMGRDLLERGLPPLPRDLASVFALPIAFGTTPTRGLVLFWIHDEEADGSARSQIFNASYERVGGSWQTCGVMSGTEWSWDPSRSPQGEQDLGGRSIIWGGKHQDGDGIIFWGWHSEGVTEIALVRDQLVQAKAADGHFGAWVVGSDEPEPFKIEARDVTGHVVGNIDSAKPHLP
jgi:hypothetical protein